ncbi:DUF4124 domain-containing protein [Glaciecola sp. 2405UD65-10]|jgi:hypothetical protein|uniref:DUF4124 domain-containing protein n=1 Tax=Glaciecola sp. 2405UD65-10 TaxID=3397244 RepID=UPI003B5CE025
MQYGLNVKRVMYVAMLLVVSESSYADPEKIYKTVHADGTVSYSDQPSKGAIEVEMNTSSTTIQSVAPPSTSTLPSPANQVTYSVNIVSPVQDATFRNNTGSVSIAAQIAPPSPGIFELSINKQIYTSTSGLFNVSDLDRGTYQYHVKYTDNSGKVIASSESRTLHLHKPSVLIN